MKKQLFTAVATVLALASLEASAFATAPETTPAPAAAAPRPRKARAAPVTVVNAAPTTIVAAAQPSEPEPVKPETEVTPAPAPPLPPAPTPPPAPAVPRGEGGESLAIEPPSAATPAQPGLIVRPYFLISGGLKYDIPKGRPEETKENRVSTFALGRLGAKAAWSDLVDAESEFMASGGTSLHGTSAYEGQAAMQVRQQVVRLHRGVWRVEAGRLIDEASVDFFSAHIAETFLQDTATRDPLLFDGFNLGNGVRGQLEVVKGLRLALTFNAGNPIATTSSLMIGGSYPPFERFYTQAYQSVGQVANHFPDDTFHIMMLTPAVLVDTQYVDAKIAVQGFDVNTNTNSGSDDHIRGYNIRGTMRLKLLDGVLVPFLSGAYTRNDTLVANDLSKRAADRYQAVNLGGGIDIDVARRFQCAYDCADGFGLQYQQVQFQIGNGLVTTNHYANLGGTFWVAPNVSLGLRFAFWDTKQEYSAATGEKSGILALRFIMN
ncbi:MAG: hypothetical protein JWO86_481 [Myxococcaceae bacterium]|nr:hypothetical protein [Myxococcaceae bacterium]